MTFSYDVQTGTLQIRKEIIDGVIKDFAKKSFVFKDALTVTSTSAWKNTYWQEDPTVLTARSPSNIKGVAPGANFPQASVPFLERTGRILKFAFEDSILWEDILAGQVAVQARTLMRVSEAVVSAVDSFIWDELTESRSPVQIQTFTLSPNYQWDAASAAILDDLMHAKQLIGTNWYNTGNLRVFISDRDHRSMVNYLTSKGAQFPQLSTTVAENGSVGNLAGMDIRVSPNVTASYALVVVPKVCATYQQLVPLTTNTTEDPFKSVRIRAVEEGQVQLTDPLAIVLIKNTQSASA